MKKIIVIEDEAPVLDNILDTLEAEHFEALGAEGGLAGLQMVREVLPDLVICDVMMPDLDGFGVLEELHNDPKTATIPFIFLTARATKDDMRIGMNLGADDYLTKPFTPHELLSAVRARFKKQGELGRKYETTMHLLRKNIAYALPHELRTPLIGILGYGEILKMDHDRLNPEEILQYADGIVTSGNRLHRVIENYLVYAQIELLVTDPDQVEALRNHIIKDTSVLIETHARKIAETYQREEDLVLNLCNPAMRISAEDLGKIVDELTDNAFKFSDPGSVVQVRSERDDHHMTLTFRDSGRGMGPDDIKNLGAYMQFERTMYEQQGLGLGFSIAKRLVELHGGQIAVRSHPNQGTLVGLRFPI